MRRSYPVWILAAAAAIGLLAAGFLAAQDPMAAKSQEPAQKEPYTATFFGPWNEAMAKVHIPEVAFKKTEDGIDVTVTVDKHPMDPAKPHYIMWIRIEDMNGKVLAQHDFKPTDPAPVATFKFKTLPDKIKVFERCNIHGIWLHEAAVEIK
jgi:desulfoferrodoxin-like iron-binding protein